MLLDQNLGLPDEDIAHPVLSDRGVTEENATSTGYPYLPLPSRRLDPTPRTNYFPDPSIATDSHKQAWQRLISHTIPHDELPSLIEAIFSDREAVKSGECLQENDAQAFINILDEARYHILYLRGTC